MSLSVTQLTELDSVTQHNSRLRNAVKHSTCRSQANKQEFVHGRVNAPRVRNQQVGERRRKEDPPHDSQGFAVHIPPFFCLDRTASVKPKPSASFQPAVAQQFPLNHTHGRQCRGVPARAGRSLNEKPPVGSKSNRGFSSIRLSKGKIRSALSMSFDRAASGRANTQPGAGGALVSALLRGPYMRDSRSGAPRVVPTPNEIDIGSSITRQTSKAFSRTFRALPDCAT